MDAEAMKNVRQFVCDISLFGSKLSHVLHNFATLERHNECYFSEVLGYLDATVHTLNQVGIHVDREVQSRSKDPHDGLFNDDGVKYVEVVAEECSVAIEKFRTIIAGDKDKKPADPKYWKSIVSINENGRKVLAMPHLDEAELFRKFDSINWYRRSLKLEDVADRLKSLQMYLLLVVQILTVRDMAYKL